MKIWIEYSIKDFNEEKLTAAIDACKAVCADCEMGLDVCMYSSNECAMKSTIESLTGMERVGHNVRRYREIKGLNDQ